MMMKDITVILWMVSMKELMIMIIVIAMLLIIIQILSQK